MPFISFTPGTLEKSADMNANFVLAVGTDVSKTIVVTHTFTASQTFTGGFTAAAACTISAGGIAVTGNSTVTGVLTVAQPGNSLLVSTTADTTTFLTVGINSGGIPETVLLGFDAPTDVGFVGTLTNHPFTFRTNNLLSATISTAQVWTFTNGIVAPTFTGSVTGNITGNLTGTVLTASQPNITTVGTLGSLTVTGTATVGQLNLSTAVSIIVPGATSLVFVNNAVAANNLVIADNGNITVSRGTLTMSVGAIIGNLTGNVTGNLTGTVLTASQTNITAVGVLPTLSVGALTMSGATSGGTTLSLAGPITLTTATSKIIPGATGLLLRNNADSATNISISDAGLIAFRGGVSIGAAGSLALVASTTSSVSLNLPAGVAPTSPQDGDMWYDGTNVKFRVGITTKTFTLT